MSLRTPLKKHSGQQTPPLQPHEGADSRWGEKENPNHLQTTQSNLLLPKVLSLFLLQI